MKKIFALATSLLFVSSFLFAQKEKKTVSKVKVPIDSITHLITYEEVVQAQNLSADAIYNRALSWFRKYFKNPNEVIRKNDMVTHVIVGKPRFKIYNPADKEGTRTDAGLVQFTITVSVKEGRLKYELTEFNWRQTSYYAAERWLDTSAQSYSKVYEDYLRQLDEYVRALIDDLKNFVPATTPVKDKDNW